MIKFIVPIIVVLISLSLYGTLLDITPVHLNQDELGFSLNAYSIARSGFDENHRLFPLYFWHLGVMWSTPVIVYLTAIFLKLLPLSEVVIRLPSVLIGLLDVLLLYCLAKRLFKNRWFGLMAAGLLLLTPPHFIHSRLLLDNLYPLPFMLGWLLFLSYYQEKKKLLYIFLGGLILGIGVHSYHAAKIIMPLYLLMTFIFLISEIRKRWVVIPTVLLGFILPLLPLIPWLSQYPDTLTDQVRYTGLYNVNLSPLEGIGSLLTWETISNRFSIYITYFNLDFLFLTGDISLIHSTRAVGVFLLPYLILLPLGFLEIFKKKSSWGILILAGFITSPVAPALVGNQYRVSKELVILPFAALIATFGVRFLFSLNKRWRITAIILLVLIPLQFTYFLTDYYTGYRVRSYTWFNYDIPSAFERLIKDSEEKTSNTIYIDNKISFADRYWRFFLIKHHQENLSGKTLFFAGSNFSINENYPNSLLLYRFDSLPRPTDFNRVERVIELDGFTSFYIFRN